MLQEGLIDAVYEAGAIPDRWPALLERLASSYGSIGCILLASSDFGERWLTSPGVADLMDAFVAGGWMEHNSRVTRLLGAQPYAGFRTDRDFHSAEEIASLPMYADFLTPNGLEAGAATLVAGAGGDGIILTFEGFPGDARARAALPQLDELRPHLARAATLSARLQLDRAKAAVATMESLGTPAAMLDPNGRPRAMNASFEALLGRLLTDTPNGLRLFDRTADLLFRQTIAIRDTDGASIPLGRDATEPAALHLIPVRGDARDVFAGIGTLAVVAQARTDRAPDVDLLQLMFDLTPAEADTARQVALGRSTREIAVELGKGMETVRSQLKAALLKTGSQRQSELAVLLSRLA
ncbi:MAG TPA: helix-turn-helix transcriptional regulator [Sphingobium sp.]